MDAKTLSSIFIKSTQYVLDTMAQCPAKAGKPFIKKDQVALGEMSAYICANCNATNAKGSIAISFTTPAAICVAKTMLGEDVEDEQSLHEIVGELVNIISGDARRRMAELDVIFDGSTPKMLHGEGHLISHGIKAPVVAIPFTLPEGTFTVEFGFEL